MRVVYVICKVMLFGVIVIIINYFYVLVVKVGYG